MSRAFQSRSTAVNQIQQQLSHCSTVVPFCPIQALAFDDGTQPSPEIINEWFGIVAAVNGGKKKKKKKKNKKSQNGGSSAEAKAQSNVTPCIAVHCVAGKSNFACGVLIPATSALFCKATR